MTGSEVPTADLREPTRAPTLRPWARIGYGALFALIAGAAVVSIVADEATSAAAGAAGLLVAYVTAGSTFFVRAGAVAAGERNAWRTIGSGMMIAAAGIVAMGVLTVAGYEPPAFGPVDLFFIAAYLAILAGLARLPHTAGSRWQRVRVAADGLIGAVSLTAVLWVLFLGDFVASFARAPFWERVVGSAYPFLDVAAFVVIMVVTIRRSTYRFDPRLVLFAVGVVVQALADMDFLVDGLGSSFVDATPNHALYLFAAACYLGAALLVDRQPAPREYAERRSPVWALIAPYASALVMLVVLVLHLGGSTLSVEDRVLLVATLITAGLVIARQGVAIRENRILVDRERAALVSSISHELRTPLTSLVGFCEVLLEDADLRPDRRDMLEIVRDQAVYMSRIVSDLVMLSRSDSTTVPLHVGPVKVADLVTAAVRVSAVDPGGIEVDVPRNLVVAVDADRLQQVVVNLVTNAERYGGGKTLVRAFVARGTDLVVEVHDDGPGVPKRYELLIWERFERGPHRYDATTPGSGIGLAIVDAVAKAHGGTVAYRRSELLGGSCFSLRLPGRVLSMETAEDLSAP